MENKEIYNLLLNDNCNIYNENMNNHEQSGTISNKFNNNSLDTFSKIKKSEFGPAWSRHFSEHPTWKLF